MGPLILLVCVRTHNTSTACSSGKCSEMKNNLDFKKCIFHSKICFTLKCLFYVKKNINTKIFIILLLLHSLPAGSRGFLEAHGESNLLWSDAGWLDSTTPWFCHWWSGCHNTERLYAGKILGVCYSQYSKIIDICK